MSFSWQILGRNGEDLCAKYSINPHAFGLGPNSAGATEARFRLGDIRNEFVNVRFKEDHPPAARAAVALCQELARANLNSLAPHHCETCCCEKIVPDGWSAEAIEQFLSLPLDEVWKAKGGY